MDKSVLMDYVDTCMLIKETEREIELLKSKRRDIAQEVVTGSNPEFPYEKRTFKVTGTLYSFEDDRRLMKAEAILDHRLIEMQEKKLQVEEWMNTIPSRIQRIIRYRIFQGLPWETVADRMGRNSSGDAIRMELNNFLKN